MHVLPALWLYLERSTRSFHFKNCIDHPFNGVLTEFKNVPFRNSGRIFCSISHFLFYIRMPYGT